MPKRNTIFLEEGEILVEKIRKSIVVLFPSFLVSFFLIFFATKALGGISFLLLFLLGIFLGFRALFFWYRNIFFLTNRKIIFWSQQNLFHRMVSEVPLSKVQNLSLRREEWLEKIFALGTLEVQIEGTHVLFGMSHILRAERVLSKLQALIEKVPSQDHIPPKENFISHSRLLIIEGDLQALSKDDIFLLVKEIIQLLTKIRKRIGKEAFRKLLSLPKEK